MPKGMLDGLPKPTTKDIALPAGLMDGLTTESNPIVERRTPAPQQEPPKAEPPKQVQPEAITDQPEPQAEPPIETQETTPPVETQQEDPWQLVRERFKEREPKEVLDEYDSLAKEREELRLQLEERENRAKELQEKLVQYDATHDPDYQKNAVQPIKEAVEVMLEVCLQDKDVAQQLYDLQKNRELDPKERNAKVGEILNEYGISRADFVRAFQSIEKAHQGAEAFKKDYAKYRTQREQERVRQMEADAQQNLQNFRNVQRTAAYRVETRLKESGLDYLPGYEEARQEHLAEVERVIAGGAPNFEDATHLQILGRMVLKGHKGLKEKLAKLAQLEAAGRSTPSKSPEGKPTQKGSDIKVPSQLIPM